MFHINHLRLPAAFSGSVAREGEFPGDEVDRGGMYSTDRYPRALRFTAENRLLSPSIKAVVRP